VLNFETSGVQISKANKKEIFWFVAAFVWTAQRVARATIVGHSQEPMYFPRGEKARHSGAE
jgi:hypothetical protein